MEKKLNMLINEEWNNIARLGKGMKVDMLPVTPKHPDACNGTS